MSLSFPATKRKAATTTAKPTALVQQQEYTKDQLEQIHQFDWNSRFGPHIGLSRMERWQRADRFGLDPPIEIRDLLALNRVFAETRIELSSE